MNNAFLNENTRKNNTIKVIKILVTQMVQIILYNYKKVKYIYKNRYNCFVLIRKMHSALVNSNASHLK